MLDYKEYLSINPDIRFGKTCIIGTRITVYDVLRSSSIITVLFSVVLLIFCYVIFLNNSLAILSKNALQKIKITYSNGTLINELLLSWYASGMSTKEILEDFPELSEIQLRACFAYAA